MRMLVIPVVAVVHHVGVLRLMVLSASVIMIAFNYMETAVMMCIQIVEIQVSGQLLLEKLLTMYVLIIQKCKTDFSCRS